MPIDDPRTGHVWERDQRCTRCGAAINTPAYTEPCPGGTEEYPSSATDAAWIKEKRRFAAACAALQGFLANPAWNAGILLQYGIDEQQGFAFAAKVAVAYADALIAALKEKP